MTTTTPSTTDPHTGFHHTADCAGQNYTYFTGNAGDAMVQCGNCKRSVPLERLQVETRDPHWLLLCLCGVQLTVTRSEPRIPLCEPCSGKRREKRRARRSGRRSDFLAEESSEW